jgi:hypothetical protein
MTIIDDSLVHYASELALAGISRETIDPLDTPNSTLVEFIIEIQSGLQPHLLLTPPNVKAMWENINKDEAIKDAIFNSTVWWRSVGSFHSQRYKELVNDLAHAVDLGPVPSAYVDLTGIQLASELPAAIANELTNTTAAKEYLFSNPWLTTILLIRLGNSIVSSLSKEVKDSLQDKPKQKR